MRKTSVVLILCMLLTILLGGCGQGDLANRENLVEDSDTFMGGSDTSTGDMDPSMEEQITAARDIFSAQQLLEDGEWRDNSLDNYMAVLHVPLTSRQEDRVYRWGFAMGNTRGAAWLKHFPDSAEDSRDELRMITEQGEKSSVRPAYREDTGNQAWGIGSIVGSDHFLMLDMDTPGITGDGWRYRFFEIDENAQKVRTVELDFLPRDGEEEPGEFIVDQSGNIHFITNRGSMVEDDPGEQKSYYYITDPEGVILAKHDYSHLATRLVTLYDGRVAIWSQPVDDEGVWTGSRLEYVDTVTGKVTLLAELEDGYWRTIAEQIYYTLWDEKTLLYADSRGLYFADLSGEKTEDLYLWSQHGIRASQIEEIRFGEDGHINLIYYDNNDDGNLLCLKPTDEEVEIQEIVFAVQPFFEYMYRPIVAEFHKRYPSYQIVLKPTYEKTALLTELMAGKGPVLVDTWYTGFDSHKELWTPLEGLFTGEQWEEVLIPQAMEPGKIDGTLYGVVDNFSLNTVVIAGDEPTDWDYQAFLDAVEAAGSIQVISNGYNDIWTFIDTFLIHGLEDNYLLDAESGTTYFDSDEFRRVLELGMKYCNNSDDYVWADGSLREGEAFCNVIRITRPEDVDMYRFYFGKDFNHIGFPARNGSAHYIEAHDPIAIRVTASDEEKRIAGAFLRLVLSREIQLDRFTDSNFWLSVRRDVLEEQIGNINEHSDPAIYGFTQVQLGDDHDREYDAQVLYELLEVAGPDRDFPSELGSILFEELEEYFVGDITEDVLIDRLTRRVELYLAEQR